MARLNVNADRIGRKALILACFLAPPPGLLAQTAAVEPWHFWVGTVLSTILGFSTVAGAALLTDIFPEALALPNATPWIGLSVGGLALRALQMQRSSCSYRSRKPHRNSAWGCPKSTPAMSARRARSAVSRYPASG